jgi:hypothetical protein
MSKDIDKQFFKVPLYFYDYGLQVFSHIEYDILQYILRNTLGWQKFECEASIKTIALHRHYNEKNIINAINNLIKKTGVFNKIVYREKGSYIKKAKYFITEKSVSILNNYVKKNLPPEYEEKKKKIKNRTIEAEKRFEAMKQELLNKQLELLPQEKEYTDNTTSNEAEMNFETLTFQLEAFKEILNNYDKTSNETTRCMNRTIHHNIFKEFKEEMYDTYFGKIPIEKDDEKIDIRLYDLIPLTDDTKTKDFYNTLIKNEKFQGGQLQYFYNTLKINFGITKSYDRINVIFEPQERVYLQKEERTGDKRFLSELSFVEFIKQFPGLDFKDRNLHYDKTIEAFKEIADKIKNSKIVKTKSKEKEPKQKTKSEYDPLEVLNNF